MSPNVSSFVGDLVEMAKAFEELPQVQHALAERERENIEQFAKIQAREDSILRLKAEIEALQAKVRDTEAQRDDAELRFLEGEDRTRSALDFIKSTFGSAGSLIQALEPPPKVEPVVEPMPEVVHTVDPISASTDQTSVHTQPVETQESASSHYEQPVNVGQRDNPQGQSAADPTPATIQQVETEPPTGSVSETVTIKADASGDDVGYHNEPKIDGANWYSWDAWCTRMNERFGPGNWPVRPATA